MPLTGSSAKVTSLAFNREGNKLFTGLENGTIQVWDLDVEKLIERACQVAGRNMDRNEWWQFFGNQEYDATCDEFPLGD